MVNSMANIIDLRAAQPEDTPHIGNKAAGLAELNRGGQNVPPGFAITTAVHRHWLTHGQVDELDKDQILTAFHSMSPPVAVRSSSPAEDRADASFAGQYQTVLGVHTETELLDAIVTCWESVASSGATSYRLDQGDESEAEMAIVVQELVPATASGVLFTLHPVTERVDQVVINANYGLGESVVSGRTEPDTFVLDKASGDIVQSQCGAKRIATRLAVQGIEEIPLSDRLREQLCLDAAQLARLATLAREVEDHYDFPMDLEWAFNGDSLYVLQARPVTTGAEAYFTDLLDTWARDRNLQDDPESLWARGTPLSGLAVTPLYYSEMAAFFSDMFPTVARLRGVPTDPDKQFRYHRGYTYTRIGFSSSADPSGTVQPTGFLSPEWRTNLRVAIQFPRSLAFWCNIDYYYGAWKHVWGPGLEANRPDYSVATAEQIRQYIEYVESQRRDRSIVAASAVGYANNFLGLLAWLLERWAATNAEDTIGVLTSGLTDSLTHEENVALWRLAKHAEQDTALREVLVDEAFEKLESLDAGKAFLAEVDQFREQRAHRGCSDRDLYQSRWGDSREPLLKQVAVMLKLGEQADPELAHARAAAKRNELEQQLLVDVGRGIAGPLRKRIFQRVLRATQRYWMHRDNQRHTFDRYFWELRRAYRALGERLESAGALDRSDDVFFVGKQEIYAWLDGELSSDRLRSRANWRREWWSRVSLEEPPERLVGNQPAEVDEGERSGDLKGTPGAPGTASGPVRIVRSLDELGKAQSGDILVTHAIDPAWTPIFGIIAGVISEEGGMLSHATVLGREYGLPVVIGASGACAKLDGVEQVEINGTRGLVHIVTE